MPRDQELPILRAFYDFVLWLAPKIAKFPRDHRFVLGERMERQLYVVLENLIRAKYTRQRAPILQEVNVDLEILRFQLRLAKDLKCLPVKAYGLAAERLVEIGRQVGGWQRQARTSTALRPRAGWPEPGDSRIASGVPCAVQAIVRCRCSVTGQTRKRPGGTSRLQEFERSAGPAFTSRCVRTQIAGLASTPGLCRAVVGRMRF